ncbi:MAG: hypothetical protein ACFFCM_08335 [Promethearchaeota archaeon]
MSQNEILKQINELLQQAEAEENNYNWNKEIKILKRVDKISSDYKLREIEGDTNYKLGEIYGIATEFGKTQEEIENLFQLSIASFQKAINIFEELKLEHKTNAALGQIYLFKFVLGDEEKKEDFLLNSAKSFFNKAKKIYSEKKNLIDTLKMEICEIGALSHLVGKRVLCIDKKIDLTKLVSKFDRLTNKIWKNIEKEPDIPEIYIFYYITYILLFLNGMYTEFSIEGLDFKQILLQQLDRLEEFIDLFENSNKNLILYEAYVISAILRQFYTTHFTDNQFELKKYNKKIQKWLKKAEILLQSVEHNNMLKAFFYGSRVVATIIFLSLGYSTRDFKTFLNDYDYVIDSVLLTYPRYIALDFVVGIIILILKFVHASYLPDIERFKLAKKALNFTHFITQKIPMINDPSYTLIYLQRATCLGSANAIIGDLIKEGKEKSNYLNEASKFFPSLSKIEPEKLKSSFSYVNPCFHACRTATILADNTSIKSKKVEYYQKAIDFLLVSKDFLLKNKDYLLIQYLIIIPSLYYNLGRLINDEKIFKKANSAYMDAIRYYKDRGYSNLVGSAYIRIAQIEDRLGNFLSAADNYQKAIDSYEQAILTLSYTKLGNKIEKLKNYLKAWNLIEVAKSFHVKEAHDKAQMYYEQASDKLKNLREYKYEAPFYAAWAVLENAEKLSKENRHQEAADKYLIANKNFNKTIGILNSYLDKITAPRHKERIPKLIKVADVRERYCTARYQIENARLESKRGNHLTAAELYNKSSSLFENLCNTYRIEREKDELTAVYYLCKAWEHMERADEKRQASIYGSAAELFKKASNMFPESRMQKLSLGNSLYCSALQCGSLFDKTTELDEKIKFYKKIKMHLRESSKNYQLGGFEQDSQWALATSTFFDGMWNLIQADNEIDGSKKSQFLKMATNYLESASIIFKQAGYEQKNDIILNYLKMIKNEQAILTSALNIIEKPIISASSIGIVAPSCPIEISSQISLEEMQQYDLQTESELNWRKRIHHIYFYTSDGGCIYDHSFKVEEEISANLVAGGLTGVDALVQEVTQTETKIKIIEKEDMTILLEHGRYISAALVTEESLLTLRNKLKQSIQEVENFFKEELATFSGNITPFKKIEKFIQKIFET